MRWVLLTLFIFVTLPLFAEEGVSVSVEFSDGTKTAGLLRNTNDEPLRVFNIELKKWQRFPLIDIVSIEMEVVKKEKLQAWRFKEEGKPEKVYLDKWYWRFYYEAVVTLKTGKKVRGHISAVMFLKVGDRSQRIFLRRYQKTKPDQKPEEVVYVKRIVFEGAKADEDGEGCRIYGTINPADMVEAVKAMRHSVYEVYTGRLNEDSSKYVVKELPSGVYDLFLLTDKQVFVYLGLEGEGLKDSLTDEDKALIAKNVSEIEDFYEIREVMFATGCAECAKVLVRKVRKKKTTLEKKDDLPLMFLAFEVLVMKKVEKRWVITKRMHLYREKFTQNEEEKKMKEVVVLSVLGNKDLKKEKRLRFDIDLTTGR